MVEGEFHHIGVASQDLARDRRALEAMGYEPEGPEFLDPIQGIRGQFLRGPGPRLELVSPVAPGGVLQPWLERGAKMYHLAFAVERLEVEVERLEQARGRLVAGPVPAVGFQGRAIAFVMLPNLMLVELIQE
jgi:methylmalonyl-CoA/ethylmalonyl-CoA epimerase